MHIFQHNKLDFDKAQIDAILLEITAQTGIPRRKIDILELSKHKGQLMAQYDLKPKLIDRIRAAQGKEYDRPVRDAVFLPL